MKRPFPNPAWRWLAPALLVLLPSSAHSFCGFYVAAGDAKIFNHASQVVLVRDQDRTVLTMANDFQGEPKEFAIVVPVPTVLREDQIHIADRALVEHLDRYTAPRLVEYFDEDPCSVRELAMTKSMAGAQMADAAGRSARRANALGVTIEARYTVGEYDILILSAKQSSGLETWLTENGYRIPPGARRPLEAYLKQGLKFFVAKVNLKEQSKLGFTYLRPIQMAFESPRFMLPIRLGMANANGPQELFVYALTRNGRVETVNYRTVKLPSDAEVPEFVKEDFANFYRDLFRHYAATQGAVAVTEYAWDMSWCDPCASEPLSQDELRELGVFWVNPGGGGVSGGRNFVPGGPAPVFVTRLHVRYDRASFPEDLAFQVTGDRNNFQGRYIIRHEWKGDDSCPAAAQYRASLRERREKQARTLADLTGWSLDKVRGRMAVAEDWTTPADDITWWQRLWKK
jgi:hypothetical protein